MRIKSTATVVMALTLTLTCVTGCQQMRLVFHQPAHPTARHCDKPQGDARHVILASLKTRDNSFKRSSDCGLQQPPDDQKNKVDRKAPHSRTVDKDSDQHPPKSSRETQEPVKDEPPKGDGKQEEGPPSESTAVAPSSVAALPYTAPGSAYQRLAVAVAGSVVGVFTEAMDAGREMSESVMFSSEGVGGRLGLTAPPTRTGGSVVGKSGLQRGDPTGLGFAMPSRTIFTPQVNRLSGPNGGCAALARAGFHGGIAHNCESALRR